MGESKIQEKLDEAVFLIEEPENKKLVKSKTLTNIEKINVPNLTVTKTIPKINYYKN